MRYFSTFSGIGGFELGINLAYEDYLSLWSKTTQKRNGTQSPVQQSLESKRSSTQRARYSSCARCLRYPPLDAQPPDCIGYSEINPAALAIYQHHYPSHHNYGDITTINPKEIPDFDLLVGGFPCQVFSMSGKRKGFSDPRGSLFFEIIRIIREKQPRLLLLENVTGLLSHDQGQTFATILSSLSQVGYDCQWQVRNSKYFGVPQNRERIFIICHLRDTPRPQVFPLGQTETIHSSSQKAQEVYASALTKRQYANWNGTYIKEALDHVRRLTPIECERLQGFPDGWTAKGLDSDGKEILMSDAKRYAVLGNAVTVSVIHKIMLFMIQEFHLCHSLI